MVSLFFASAALCAQVNLKFLSDVYVDSAQIYLSDLIDSKGLPQGLAKDLSGIVVGDTPKNGETNRLSSFAISEILRFNLKDQLSNLNIRIPSEIRVQRKHNRITAEEIKSKLTNWILPTCEPCTIQIDALQIQNDGVIEPTLRWDLSTTQIMPKGNFNISVDLYNNDNFVKKIFVQGNLHIYKMVPVAKRTLPIGTKIQKEDYALQKQDITFSRDTIPAEIEILGSETSQYVAANQPLFKGVLKRRLALMRGAPVQVVLENEGWQIHFSGVAQDNGYVGDIAKVLNPQTKKVVTGVITDENLVEVR